MAEEHFVRLKEYKVICCKQCKHAVWPKEVVTHLVDKNKTHKVRRKKAREIEEEVMRWEDVAHSFDDIVVPGHTAKPIPGLEVFRDGLICQIKGSECRVIRRGVKSIRSHLSDKHPNEEGRRRRGRPGNVKPVNESVLKPWKPVVCQRLFASRKGSQYFQVDDPDDDDDDDENNMLMAQVPEHRIEQARRALKRREVKVDKRTSIITEGEKDEVNPFVTRAGWKGYLDGYDRHELIKVVSEPDPRKEPIAYRIWQAMDDLARTCQQTVATRVGHLTRMEAVRVEAAQTKYQPLTAYMREREIKTYCLPWKRTLMFVIRQQRKHKYNSPKYKLDRSERETLDEVKRIAVREVTSDETVSWDSDEEVEFSDVSCDERPGTSQSVKKESEDNGQVTGLQRAILKFCIAMLARQIKNTEYESVLVCSIAVLGVGENGWKSASNYTPTLSHIIKVARLMVVQEAWQLTGGPNEIEESKPGCAALVKKMMDRFMIRGTHGAMSWMLDLRTYGLKIHYNTTSEGHVDWVGEQIRYKKIEFSMRESCGRRYRTL